MDRFMKTLLRVVVVFCFIFGCTSCSEEVSNIPSTSYTKVETSPAPVKDFLSSLDSLNTCYNSIWSNTRGNITSKNNDLEKLETNNMLSKKIADYIGGIAGGYGGKWLGTALGATSRNPYVTTMGGWLGKQVGAALGAVVFSFLAKEETTTPPSKGTLLNPTNSVIISSNFQPTPVDSIGKLHNFVMDKLSSNGAKYKNSNGNIDYDLIYSDCVNYLKDQGVYNDTVANDVDYRNNILTVAKEVENIEKSCYAGNISADMMLDECSALLQQHYGISEEDIADIKSMATSMLSTCSGMENAQIESYSADVSTLIQNSNMSSSKKEEVSTSVNVIINSNIYWDNQR